MNRPQKEALKEKIERLDASEQAQVFETIQRYTDTFTRADNLVWVSTDALSEECLSEIQKLVTYYIDQRKSLEISRKR